MKSVLVLFSMLMLVTANAQDWANLEHFRAANAKIELPKANENRVVFMGNSITIGWLNTMPEFFEGKAYINRGISGQTTPQMLLRFRQDVIALQPKVVVILAGTNDIAGNTGPSTLNMIADNIKSMAELAVSHGIKVVLSSTLPAYDYPWKPGLEPAGKIIALNKILKEYADQNGHVYLDYFSAMADERNGLPKKYANDEVHPTKLGYEVMAPLAEAAISKAMNYTTFKDRVTNTETVQEMANLRTDFELDQKQIEVDALNAQTRNQRHIFIAMTIIAGLTILLLIILFLYYRAVSKKK
ncbi:MAG: SGNH/GDSL hydrolase family protein [Maribacter sp.]